MGEEPMNVFLAMNHLFLRNPRGGVEDVAAMKAAGFGAIFCNIGDFAPAEWQTVRDRARAAGVVCGPWLRTEAAGGGFDFDKFHRLLSVADDWAAPLIVNSESELKDSGGEITTYIDAQIGSRDAAISVEPWPFDNVSWTPFANRPVLPQLSKSVTAYREQGLRDIWHAYGVECVVLTFGSFGGSVAADYDRLAPFGVYTADDCGGQYQAWATAGTCEPCATPTPPREGKQMIGDQDGVDATCNRLRDMDPDGTIMVKVLNDKGKLVWPGLDSLEGTPLSKWKAYDKLQRSLSILIADHDEAI